MRYFATLLICSVLGAVPCTGQPTPPSLSELTPGLYYYQEPTSGRRSIYYVPNPADPKEDPFSLTEKPLPPDYVPLVMARDPNEPATAPASQPIAAEPPSAFPQQNKLNWCSWPNDVLAGARSVLSGLGKGISETAGLLGFLLAPSMGGAYGYGPSGSGNFPVFFPPSGLPGGPGLGFSSSPGLLMPDFGWGGGFNGFPPGGGFGIFPYGGGPPAMAMPTIGGGYNVSSGYGGPPTRIMPTIGGGYNVFSPGGGPPTRAVPTIGGGYNVFPPGGGPPERVMRTIGGGYEIFPSGGGPPAMAMPTIGGGYNVSSGYGGPPTRIMPTIGGGYNVFSPGGGPPTMMMPMFGFR